MITETRTLQLTSFSPVSDEELTSVIKSMSKKFCDLDPIPTKLLLNCLPELLPLISFIVNESLSKGVFPQQLKEALVRPSLKKPSLDSEYPGVAELGGPGGPWPPQKF